MFRWQPKPSQKNAKHGLIVYMRKDGSEDQERSIYFYRYLDTKNYGLHWNTEINAARFFAVINKILERARDLPIPRNRVSTIIHHQELLSGPLKDMLFDPPIQIGGTIAGIPLSSISWIRLDIPAPNRGIPNSLTLKAGQTGAVEVPPLLPLGIALCCGFRNEDTPMDIYPSFDFGAIETLKPIETILQFWSATINWTHLPEDLISLRQILNHLLPRSIH